MVVGAEGRDDARNGLGEGALEEGVAFVWEKASHLHYDRRQVHMRRLAADRVPCVAHGLKFMAGDVEGGLNADALTDLELRGPLRANLAHDAGYLVSEHDGIRRDVLRHALVSRAERHRLVVAEAYRVGHDFNNNTVIACFFELDVFKPGVLRPVEPPCLCIHFVFSFTILRAYFSISSIRSKLQDIA